MGSLIACFTTRPPSDRFAATLPPSTRSITILPDLSSSSSPPPAHFGRSVIADSQTSTSSSSSTSIDFHPYRRRSSIPSTSTPTSYLPAPRRQQSQPRGRLPRDHRCRQDLRPPAQREARRPSRRDRQVRTGSQGIGSTGSKGPTDEDPHRGGDRRGPGWLEALQGTDGPSDHSVRPRVVLDRTREPGRGGCQVCRTAGKLSHTINLSA